MVDTAVLDKLRQYDTPTICNIIELFDVRPHSSGYMTDPHIRLQFAEMGPVVGFAATAVVRSAMAPAGGRAEQQGNYDWLSAQVAGFADLAGPAVVVLQDVDSPLVAAVFGEVMCTTYQTFGAVGLVTNGAGRDLDQVRGLGFPVFTHNAICSHGYFHATDVAVPVQVGGLVVQQNDLLHGDLNGVTNIPATIAAAVADIAAEFVAAEAIILDTLTGSDGPPTMAALQAARAESKAQVTALRDRVRRSTGE